MPTLLDRRISTGARFIEHDEGADKLIFEALDGHLRTISIHSPRIRLYYELLGSGGAQLGTSKTIGEIVPPDESHDAAHELGITYGKDHSHWGSRRDSIYDGFTVLAMLSTYVAMPALYEVATIVKRDT